MTSFVFSFGVLIVCLAMWRFAGSKADCPYCGGRLRRHHGGCPYGGIQ